jgi:predicted O-methyltransferase YrrM
MNGQYTNNWFDGGIQLFSSLLSKYKDSEAKFLELGSYEGRSTCWVLENILTSDKAKITCIDTWQGGWEHNAGEMHDVERRFIENTAPFTDKIEKIKATTKDALVSIQDRKAYYDFIYIDAGHTMYDVLVDCLLSFDLLKVGGIMAFDDYEWDLGSDASKKPKLAIDCLLLALGGKIRVISKAYQVWIEKIG